MVTRSTLPVAAWSSSLISSRTSSMRFFVDPVGSERGIISSVTRVPFLPRIFLMDFFIGCHMTSSISPSPWRTPTILSPSFMRPSLSTGPPGMISTILSAPSSIDRTAPTPQSVRFISMSKSSLDVGDM